MSILQHPPSLQKGDKVAILSTARKISLEDIEWAKAYIESWGYQVVLGKTIGLSHEQYAGNEEERAKDFQEMLDRDDIKAIICARGGYGTVRIMDLLDFTHFTNHSKWIIGYSDVTILHAHINNYLGIQTLHASMPINFKNNSKESLDSIQSALKGEKSTTTFPAHPLNRIGEVEGQVIGGNLSILYSIIGTKSGFNPDHKILFIEDLDEYLYHLDRMMMALKRAGKLDNLKALIVGGMTKMKDNTIPFGKSAKEIILEHCSGYDYPICFRSPFGHLDDNRALCLGANYTLNVSAEKVVLKAL
jgi:muramoyltetrapeptide carboxypeptidase